MYLVLAPFLSALTSSQVPTRAGSKTTSLSLGIASGCSETTPAHPLNETSIEARSTTWTPRIIPPLFVLRPLFRMPEHYRQYGRRKPHPSPEPLRGSSGGGLV